MNKSIFSVAGAIALMAGTVFSSCQSSTQKVDNAEAKVEEAKQDLKEVQQDANAQAVKAANREEWQLFKTESETKIRNNEAMIADIKVKKKGTGKTLDAVYTKNIETLEQRNKDLKNKIDSYDKNRSDWEAFKREFNHDMDEFGKAFRDLTVNNKN